MIAIRVQGGLGNQMFQYAYGRALIAEGRDVRFDLSSFQSDPLRDYELFVWRARVRVLRGSEALLKPRRFGGRGWRNLKCGKAPLRRVSEKPQGFRPERLEPAEHTYLNGYWQSEKFFARIANEIRDDFRPNRPLSDETLRTIDRVAAVNSVAVHVRRTDYLQLPHLQVCDERYQRRCVDELLAEQSNVRAFVFSDDLDWCRTNLQLPCPTEYVGHAKGADAWQKIWMMSHCRHHVIPNSTFSWWAAWLKHDRTGVTYAPNPWWNKPGCPGEDVVPTGWRQRPGKAAPTPHERRLAA